jgi:predicted NUDIX family NTP pyrophosphohydrolase
MPKHSSGILVYSWLDPHPECFLVRPGGAFWQDQAAWSIPKGEFDPERKDALISAPSEGTA